MKTVIHVEDSALILLRLAEWMAEIDPGLNVLSASSLAQAEELVRQHEPDFMVLDINLPDGNALNHIATFKKLSPGMCIAVLSSSNDSFTRDKCFQLGANWVFDKATDIPKLVGVLTEATSHWMPSKGAGAPGQPALSISSDPSEKD
jgi:DNA-binding NarL/FixJ family response regulator